MEQSAGTPDSVSAVQEVMEPWNRARLEGDWEALLAMCHDKPSWGTSISMRCSEF